MLILNQNRDQLINIDTVRSIKIIRERSNSYKILCEFPKSVTILVGEYTSLSMAKTALHSIQRAYKIKDGEYYVPQD